jgi:tetratricopeptide (TPR) repeat protein
MYQRALRGYEKALGLDHTTTLGTVTNLGLLYSKLGKLGEAEEMHQRALKGYEKSQGPDHFLTLNSLNHLGDVYADQGKIKEAEDMLTRPLVGFQTLLGSSNRKCELVSQALHSLHQPRGNITLHFLINKLDIY